MIFSPIVRIIVFRNVMELTTVKGGFAMETAIKADRESVITAMEENQKNVREMVMESYRDMQEGKGRNYKEFFSEMESRYGHGEL